MRVLPKHESEETHSSLDLPGAISVTAGLMLFVYGLTQAPTDGWTSHKVLAYFAGTLVLLTIFVINEQRAKHPLIPLSIFRLRNVTGANLIQLCISSALFSVFFFTTLYVQDILRYSPARTGFSFLAIPFAIALTAISAPRLIKRVGFKPILMISPLVSGLGLYMLAHVPVHGSYMTHVLPGLVIMGLGLGATFVSLLGAATSGVPPRLSGLASGLVNTSQQIGGALGLAVLSGISASSTTRYLEDSHPVTRATAIAATVHGFQIGYYVAVLFTIAAAFFAAVILKHSKPSENDAPAILG
jgi:predicted MFS family arabinose efflux permease